MPPPDDARTHNFAALQTIWHSLLTLGHLELDEDDDFLIVGGHSLLLIQMVQQLNQALDVDLSVHEVYQKPTVGAILDLVEAAPRPHIRHATARTARDRAGTSAVPLLPHQKARVARVRSRLPDRTAGPHDNFSAAFRLHGPVNPTLLRSALLAVVQRHDALRIRVAPDGASGSVAEASADEVLEEVDLRHTDTLTIQQALADESRRPFSLDGSPLVRPVLFRIGADEYILSIVASCVAWDGWASREIFVRSLSEAYGDVVSDQRTIPPTPPYGFTDHCLDRARTAADDEPDTAEAWRYWEIALAAVGPVPKVHLPGAGPPLPAATSRSSRRIRRALPPDLVKDLAEAEQAVTLFVLGAAALLAIFHRYSGTSDVGLLAPMENRDGQTRHIIGPFASFTVLACHVDPADTMGTILARTKDAVAHSHQHSVITHEELVTRLLPAAGSGEKEWPVRTATFSVEFGDRSTPTFPQVQSTPEAVPGQQLENTAIWLVKHDERSSPGGIDIAIQYDLAWLEPGQVESLLEDFEVTLGHIARSPATAVAHVPLRLAGNTTPSVPARWENGDAG